MQVIFSHFKADIFCFLWAFIQRKYEIGLTNFFEDISKNFVNFGQKFKKLFQVLDIFTANYTKESKDFIIKKNKKWMSKIFDQLI